MLLLVLLPIFRTVSPVTVSVAVAITPILLGSLSSLAVGSLNTLGLLDLVRTFGLVSSVFVSSVLVSPVFISPVSPVFLSPFSLPVPISVAVLIPVVLALVPVSLALGPGLAVTSRPTFLSSRNKMTDRTFTSRARPWVDSGC